MMEEEDQDMMDEHQKDDLPIAPNGYDGGRSTHNADFGRVGHNCRPFQPKQPQHHVGPVVSQGTGALLTAAGTGDLTTVQKLLAGGMPADARDEKGQTPLSLAARRGHAECAQSLLAAGADVDGRAGFGRTPLLYAACEGRLPMVQLLLRHKATIGVRDAGGDTALIWASYGGHEQCAMALLGAGADVNARDHHGGSALHHAAARGLLSLVQHLLYNMANPDLPDAAGRTAASYCLNEWEHQPVLYEDVPHERRQAVLDALQKGSAAAAASLEKLTHQFHTFGT